MPNYVIRFSFQECNYFNEALSSFYDYAFQNKSKNNFKINSKIEKKYMLIMEEVYSSGCIFCVF